MLILAVDTSGKNGSLALARFNEGAEQILQLVPIEGGTFSAQLIPQITHLLRKSGLSKQDIDGFAVVSGPGSFTGLRVGLAVIKGLAEVLQKPIAAVSLLEAIARGEAQIDCKVIAALDAGRGEVYVGRFEFQGNSLRSAQEEVRTLASVAEEVDGYRIVTPDSKLADAFTRAKLKITVSAQPRADVVARLGYEQMRRRNTLSPGSLDASYIRSSGAETKKSAQ
jgi:tRNA threonylcarbamoyladenosine biosynthesis protein TsaB